ncbi:hypothetical protein F5Y04DRAFT_270751 [Hypomontagnella monticulosa]|nr:hypothetical protein F5Y04DRAFT_270751 [Hypomontagnella monticulosa]
MGDDWQKNTSALGYPNGFAQAAFNSSSTLGVINDLKFQTAKSIRTSTIILAAFNTVSAFATAAGILYDCYVTAKRSKPEGKGRPNILFTCVRGPSTYPFVLSLGITIQGIIFAISQSFGLKGFFIPSCSLISQFMWPAVFIVPYIQLVFGLEVTFRSLKATPFPPRNKWNVPILLLVVKVLLGITGLVGVFIRPTNICFASLFWFVSKWAEGGFALLLVIIVVLAICSIVIYLRLSRYSIIEESERISASRMVYYLGLAVLTNALIVPFFINLTFSNPMDDNGGPGSTLSMISTVVANVTGLMTGGLHLFLRSNTISTIGPKDKLAEYERQKLKTEAGEGINGHILKPVPDPQSLPKTESQENLLGEKTNAAERGESPFSMNSLQTSPRNMNPLRANAVFETANIPRVPEPAQVYTTTQAGAHSRKPSASYTLFPNNNQGNTTSVALLPSTAYNPNLQPNSNQTNFPFDNINDTLRPPPSIRVPWGHHRRDSSMASSATVRIGLRISNVGDIGPMAGEASTEDEKVYALDCPHNNELGSTYRPSPLANASNTLAPQSPVYQRESVMKSVPPAPAKPEEKTDCTLSPAVYDPNSPTKAKTPSPRGVGFNVPRRVNTTPVQGTPAQPPPRNRGNSSAAADSRSDWI